MSEKEAPTWRETKGDTNGVPWRINTLQIDLAEVSLGDGFGNGVRAGVTVYRHLDDRSIHANEIAAKRAAALMLRDIADCVVHLAARLVREAQEAESDKVAP